MIEVYIKLEDNSLRFKMSDTQKHINYHGMIFNQITAQAIQRKIDLENTIREMKNEKRKIEW